MHKILVIGATGSVGKFISKEVVRQFGSSSLIIGDYKTERGKLFAQTLGEEVSTCNIDANKTENIKRALHETGVNAVIIALQQSEPLIQKICIDNKIPSIDISVKPEFTSKVQTLHETAVKQQTASLVMAGLFPGLSAVITADQVLKLSTVETVDIALLQSSNSTAGKTGIADMLSALGKPVVYSYMKKPLFKVPGFHISKEIPYPQPFGTRESRLITYPEAEVIQKMMNVKVVRYWTAFENENFNVLISILRSFGILGLFNNAKTGSKLAGIIAQVKSRKTPTSENIALYVKTTGFDNNSQKSEFEFSLTAPSDYKATAMSAVAMTKLLIHGREHIRGVHFPFEVFTLADLISSIDSPELKFFDNADNNKR
jgi:saccharopine dehydrogenase-like NADP-dependent oxidoreductase